MEEHPAPLSPPPAIVKVLASVEQDGGTAIEQTPLTEANVKAWEEKWQSIAAAGVVPSRIDTAKQHLKAYELKELAQLQQAAEAGRVDPKSYLCHKFRDEVKSDEELASQVDGANQKQLAELRLKWVNLKLQKFKTQKVQ